MSDYLAAFGPTPDQLDRVKLLVPPLFSETLDLLNLDETYFTPNAAPAARAKEFKDLSKAAQIPPATIEAGLQWVLEAQRPHLTEALELLRLGSTHPPGTTEWLTEISGQIELGGITPAVLKDAIAQAKGKRLAPRDENTVGWKGTDLPTVEKIMGTENSLLSIHFLELALQRSAAVAKIELASGSGSGFVIRNNLLVTNAHVLPDPATAATATAVFNYQKSANGTDAHPVRIALDPGATFLLSPESAHDLAIVRLAEPAAGRWTEISLTTALVRKNDRVCIIQHPGGDQKQIGMYHNLVTYSDDNVVQYLTDTLPGSSGAPVFDKAWNVVAIHHAGGYLTEPGSKEKLYRNEGIPVARLLELLA